MPLVQVKVIEGVFSASQKREMVKRITETMVSVEGENWGIGGNPLTAADVKALASGRG